MKKEENEIVITQKRFLVTADQLKVSLYSYEQLGQDYKWYVPFTYVTDYDTEPNCLWLNKTDGKFNNKILHIIVKIKPNFDFY